MKKILKRIYELIPFKQSLFLALRAVWLPPESIYRHLHFKGEMKVKIDEDHSFNIYHYGYALENMLFWSGVNSKWERITLQTWIKLCQNSDVILDLGANTGVFALIAKSLRPKASVYAFEPVERVFEKLARNVQLNGYDIKAEKLALSNNNGTATIYDPMTENVYIASVNKNLAPENVAVRQITIPTRKLATYIKENNIGKIDLMKIDVETHEPEVLEGMEEYLDKFRPSIIIEIVRDDLALRIEKLIANKGYIFFNIDDLNEPKRVERLSKSGHLNFLLCNEQVARQIGLLN